jgi:hypothetical protein
MRSYRRTLLSFLLLTVVSAAALWVFTPYYIIHRIQIEHPGTKIEKVTFTLDKVVLHDVEVDRPGVHALLPWVEIDFNEHVLIRGGTVTVTIAEKPDVSKPVVNRVFQAEDLEVTVIDQKHKVEAKLYGVSRSTLGDIEAKTGHITGAPGEANIEGLKHPHDGAYTVEEAILTPKVKLHIEGKIRVHQVEVKKFEHGSGWIVKVGNLWIDKHEARGIQATVWDTRNFAAQAYHVTVNHPWVSGSPVTFFHELHLNVREGVVSARSGDARLAWDGSVLSGEATCQDWAKAFPSGLREPLDGISFTGKLGFTADLKTPSLKTQGECRSNCSAESLKALRKPFTYFVYDSTDHLVTRESGPGSREWAGLPAAGPLPDALITLEDPGFASHRGWSPAAFEASLKANLETGKFLRGGSTLTMQLVKNLWLRRTKSLGRKAQEVMLASALESCFSKEEIIELYLNVVEFGPDLYGITAASRKYFSTTPYELTPKQAYWLVSILPAPRKAGMPDDFAMKRTEALMKNLSKNGRIPVDFAGEDPDDSAMKGWKLGEAPP